MLRAITVNEWHELKHADATRVKEAVNSIIEEVRRGGDSAIRSLSKKFDRIDLDSIIVTVDEIEEAYQSADPHVIEQLIEASARITAFHELERPKDLILNEMEHGVILGVKSTPLERIGAYIPGGRAAYPSTALMCTIAAKVAGVSEICCCTPPPINPLTLVALDIGGATEVIKAGGAQAIAAMALGTESVRPVQKIVGPGNLYVTAAKAILRDKVEIDFPAGPSELAVLADSTANPDFIASDILAQAEHDPNAACVLVTNNEKLIEKVIFSLKNQFGESQRQEILKGALLRSGYILVHDIHEGANVINSLAPEHLSLVTVDPLSNLPFIKNAGTICIGPYSAVACGDYASGTNHVLPTAGGAKIYSGLNVAHFLKTSSVQIISREGLEEIGDIVEIIANAEGLNAHANSVRIRRKNK